MKYFVTFLLAALSLNAVGQTNPNYNPDYDANGVIGVDDLLGILSTFGDTWDSGDVIVGCTYPAAVEYNSSANVDDGSCTFLPDSDCGIPVPHEGYYYSTVLIGDQCWFSENCLTYLKFQTQVLTQQMNLTILYMVIPEQRLQLLKQQLTTRLMAFSKTGLQ